MAVKDSIAKNDTGAQPKNRLLDAAETLFAASGFHATSVRDITKLAKCNVAAVNYHFSGKENLYIAVMCRRMSQMRELRLDAIEKVVSQQQPKLSLEHLLRVFSSAFLGPLLDEITGRNFMKLMVREMSDPVLPRKMFVEELVEPTMAALGAAISKLCPNLSQRDISLSIVSIVGQLVHLVHLNEMFDVADFACGSPLELEELVDHIARFSAAGIRAMDKKSR